ERHPPARGDAVGQAGRSAAGRRREGDPRARQAAGRSSGGGGDCRAPGPDRRAAVPGPGAAQGRRDEAGAGAVGLRGRPARGPRGPLPRGPDQAPGGGASAAGGDRARSARPRAGPDVARAVRGVRRPACGGGEHRPGAPGGLGRRARGRGEDPVPRCGPSAARRPAPAQPRGPALLGVHPRPRRQAVDHRAGGARQRGARLPPGGRVAADLRGGLRRRPGDPRAGGRRRHRARPRHRVDGGHTPVAHDRRRDTGGARPRLAAARALPAVRTGARRSAPRRPPSGQLPPAAGRPARRHRLRGRQPLARRFAGADRTARPAGPAGQGRRGARRAAGRGLREGVHRRRPRTGALLPAPAARAGRPAVVPVQPRVAARAGRTPRRPALTRRAARSSAQPAAVVPAHPPGDDGDHRRALPAQRRGRLPLRARELAAGLRRPRSLL
ncbi:MAG: Uncharacterized ABC1 family protein SCO5192, partial [uncultured Frankineae bacterium]